MYIRQTTKKPKKKTAVIKKKTKPAGDGIALTSMKHPPAKSKYPISKYKISKKSLEKVEIDLDLKAIKKKALAKKKSVKKKAAPQTIKIVNEFTAANNVIEVIEQQKGCFALSWDLGQVLFVKKIESMVNKVNNNSVFQPHETTNKKIYFALGIIDISGRSDEDPAFSQLRNLGCPAFKIRRLADIEHIIKDFE